jgi:hypothetical protein
VTEISQLSKLLLPRRSLLLAAPAILLLPRGARAQLPQTAAGRGSAGSSVPTTFDPATINNGTLDSSKLIFTCTTVGSSVASTTTRYNTGKKYCEFHFTGGLGGSTWVLSLINSVGSFPGAFVFAQTNSTGPWSVAGVPSATQTVLINSGDFLAAAVDFGNARAWVRSTTDNRWNADGTADPATNVGGCDISAAFTGGTFACGVNFGDNIGQVATANFGTTAGALSSSSGTWNFTPPSGYTNW